MAALVWYDEPLEFLWRCVTSLAGVADDVVAVDGAWRHFPGGTNESPRDQADAIRGAASAVGVAAHLHVPKGVFESQVAKRATVMQLAAEHGDWVFVIDADEYVAYADPAAIRACLAVTGAVCGDVGLRNPPGVIGGLTRRVYRAGTTLRLVHSGYVYEGHDLLPGEPAADLTACLTVAHDFRNRGVDRNRRDEEYRAARQRERVEVWV